MNTKKIKLKSGISATLKEMSVDDIDYCNDMPMLRYENEQVVAIQNLSKARTSWIRKGTMNCDDKFLRSLTDEDKNELSLAIKEFQRLGEENPSP